MRNTVRFVAVMGHGERTVGTVSPDRAAALGTVGLHQVACELAQMGLPVRVDVHVAGAWFPLVGAVR